MAAKKKPGKSKQSGRAKPQVATPAKRRTPATHSARRTSTPALQRKLAALVGKRLNIELPDEQTTLLIIDWHDLQRRSAQLAQRAAQAPLEERADFYSSHRDALSEISEYFLDQETEARVEEGAWLPFGLLGLMHGAESFEEIGHDGLLVLDLSASASKPPVRWVRNEASEVIADSLDTLQYSEEPE